MPFTRSLRRPSSGAFFSRATAIFTLIRGTVSARRLVNRINPRAVIGFGGYPTVPPLLAAAQLRVPTLLHEGNAVIGRANRFLASRVDAIAQGFEVLDGLPGALAAKTHLTGNPVRPMVIEAGRMAFPDCSAGKLRILVTGGSQGAAIFSGIVPDAIELMPEAARQKLIIVQQARAEDERVRDTYPAPWRRCRSGLSFSTCRDGSRKPISSLPAPGPRPSRNSP